MRWLRTRPPRSCRWLLAQAVAGSLVMASLAAAGDGPDLSPPAEMAKPASPPAAPPAARPQPGGRAVLALPGMRVAPARPAATPPNLPPALEAPERGVIRSTPAGVPEADPEPPLAAEPGIALEPPVEMGRAPAPRPSRPPAGGPVVLEPERVDPPPRNARPNPADPAPTRRGRLFGGRSAGVVEPELFRDAEKPADPPDPAAQATLRRRIEKQAYDAVGGRARTIEVKMLAGRAVTIRTQGVRFYQKRAVRKSLEGLPALSGLRSTIEVD